jgi:hypothetical protein
VCGFGLERETERLVSHGSNLMKELLRLIKEILLVRVSRGMNISQRGLISNRSWRFMSADEEEADEGFEFA